MPASILNCIALGYQQVTAGGSICIESLTLSGGTGSWQPSYSVETILNVVLVNMVDCESVWIKTISGPGGLTGPLKIDRDHRQVPKVSLSDLRWSTMWLNIQFM